MAKVTTNQLVSLLALVKGSFAVSLEIADNDPKMVVKHRETKQPNPFIGRVVKVSSMNGMAGFHYEAAVNRQLAKEGQSADFVAQPRKWGERIPKTPLVKHNDTYYLELRPMSGGSQFLVDGREATPQEEEEIKQYLPPARKPSATQGTEKEVQLRDVRLDKIKAIRFGGHSYEVVDD